MKILTVALGSSRSLDGIVIRGFCRYRTGLHGATMDIRASYEAIHGHHISYMKVLIIIFMLESTSLSVEQHDSRLHGRVSPSEKTRTQPGTVVYAITTIVAVIVTIC